jgi:hypothetical protein
MEFGGHALLRLITTQRGTLTPQRVPDCLRGPPGPEQQLTTQQPRSAVRLTHPQPAEWDEDDSIDHLDDLPDNDTGTAPAAGFGLYDAYEEADTW